MFNSSFKKKKVPGPDFCPCRKNAVEVELTKCKIDMMSLNSQLLDAIQQKVNLSQQLEAWQVSTQGAAGLITPGPPLGDCPPSLCLCPVLCLSIHGLGVWGCWGLALQEPLMSWGTGELPAPSLWAVSC